ncbi:hypothetical protein QUF90_16445 [Desulfococcaceae bacterium HSG9]|nr:hypothetical protein [Desulfococcaceae bacterium HSG9]
MTDSQTKTNKKAADWLTRFSRNLDSDPDVIEAMPIEDVRTELRALGADVEGFHNRVVNLLHPEPTAPEKPNLSNVIELFWEPVGAGMRLAAAPSSVTQDHQFETEAGVINVTCAWGGKTDTEPAFIWMAWDAHIAEESEFQIRLINPDTRATRYEIRPGRIYKGDQTFTEEEIGFNPQSEKWALSIVTAEKE